jgi:predicted nucleic acid-binding protein
LQLFDSSILIPWLRSGHYDEIVTASFEARRFLLCTVVWMELYAGTRTKADKQDLDAMQRALSSIGRVVSPAPEDFYRAGQMLASYSRLYGRIEPKDHANDVLIALSAVRVGAELVTENAEHMETWQKILARSKKSLYLRVVRRP